MEENNGWKYPSHDEIPYEVVWVWHKIMDNYYATLARHDPIKRLWKDAHSNRLIYDSNIRWWKEVDKPIPPSQKE